MSNNESLRALVVQSAKLEELMIDSGGLLTPEIEAALSVQDLKLPAKVDGYSLFLDRLAVISQDYAKKAELFSRLAGAADSAIKKLKENIEFAMVELKTEELLGNDFKFKLQNSAPSVFIEDEAKIEDAYKISKLVVSVDKKKIAEDLKVGIPVPGAILKQSQHIRKYANNKAAR